MKKSILHSKQYLNYIIDSAMNLLIYHFFDLACFQAYQLAHQLDFERHMRLFVQIINKPPSDGGSHWLTVNYLNCLIQ